MASGIRHLRTIREGCIGFPLVEYSEGIEWASGSSSEPKIQYLFYGFRENALKVLPENLAVKFRPRAEVMEEITERMSAANETASSAALYCTGHSIWAHQIAKEIERKGGWNVM